MKIRSVFVSATLACVAGIMITGCGNSFSGTDDSAEDTSAVVTEESDASDHDIAPQASVSGPLLELSGSPADVIHVDEDSYYEAEKIFLFAAKGTVIRGDIADNITRIMNELESLYGLSYAYNEYASDSDWRDVYFNGAFQDINTDLAKPSILVIQDPCDGTVQCCLPNAVKLYDTDFAPEHTSFDAVFHELAHLLRLKQSGYLGSVMEEGAALYAQDQLSRMEHFPDWSMIQYVDYGGYASAYDDSAIISDPEGEFRASMNVEGNGEQRDYQYGFRFVTFLREEYGDDIIAEISTNARSRALDSNGSDVDAIVEVIKESTSEDVFVRFAEWLPSGWDSYCADYVEYIESFANQ